MFYRENGQFKTSYRADLQIFPIEQDRWAIALIALFALVVVPMVASDYMFRAILIPFVIMSLAAVGVNILVGYCGQISLGSGAFMAVGAYGAYNFFMRGAWHALGSRADLGRTVRHIFWYFVWAAQPARERPLFGSGNFGRAIFCGLDVFAYQLVYLRFDFRIDFCQQPASLWDSYRKRSKQIPFLYGHIDPHCVDG